MFSARRFKIVSTLFFVLVFIVSSFIVSPFPAHAGLILQHPNYTSLTSGLVGFWSFDGKDISNLTALDRSGQGNNGTLTNGPVRTIGKLGQALDFDGSNDYVNVGDHSSLDLGDVLTYSLWVKRDRSSFSTYEVLMSKGAGTFVLVFTVDNTVSANKHSSGEIAESNQAISDGAWHHIVAAKNGSAFFKIYIDGIDRTGSVTDKTLTNGDSSLRLGTESPVAGNYFDGSIDDVRIYNRALSADEIKRLYRIGATLHVNTQINNDSLARGLVGYWSFNDNDLAGSTAYDKSGQSNNGTLTNGPTRAIGKIGQALKFDGVNDYVSTASNVLDPAATDFTATAWFRTNAFNGIQQDIITQLDGTGTGRSWLFINATTNAINSFLGGAGTVGSILQANTWYHITLTKSGTTITIYLNGVFNVSSTKTVGAATGVTNIGINKDGVSDPFNGQIDDVRIYNRALTPDEIKRLYNIGGTLHVNTQINNDSLSKGLVGLWSFDGKDMLATSTGSAAIDRSGN
ncbi:MAG: LamG domain-containing protein, partial [bacterium]|nr:LamG domain-containing protein [bacterium]